MERSGSLSAHFGAHVRPNCELQEDTLFCAILAKGSHDPFKQCVPSLISQFTATCAPHMRRTRRWPTRAPTTGSGAALRSNTLFAALSGGGADCSMVVPLRHGRRRGLALVQAGEWALCTRGGGGGERERRRRRSGDEVSFQAVSQSALWRFSLVHPPFLSLSRLRRPPARLLSAPLLFYTPCKNGACGRGGCDSGAAGPWRCRLLPPRLSRAQAGRL